MEKKLLSVIYVGLGLILFLPLYVAKGLYFPFVTGKTLIFRMIAEAVFFAWLILAAGFPKYRPNVKSPIFLAVSMFMLVLVVSSFTGVNAYQSWFSNFERVGGIFTFLHYYALFIVLTSVFKSKREWFNYILVALVAADLNGLYALSQKLYGWGNFGGQLSGDRVSGTLGNPTFFASYLCFNFFFALVLFFLDKRKIARNFSLASALFILYMMILSGTRGIMVGLLTALIAWVILYVFLGHNRNLKMIMAAVCAFVLFFSAAIFANGSKDWVKKNYYFDRFYSIKNFKNDASVRQRFWVWGSAWEGFKERPILGYGSENFNYVFNKNFNPIMAVGETWFDSAHNMPINILTENGVIGLVSYLVLFGMASYRCLKRKDIVGVTLVSALTAYFVQNLFVFDMFSSYMMFYFALAVCEGFGAPMEKEKNEKEIVGKKNDKNSDRNLFSDDAKAFLFVGGIILVIVFYQSNVLFLKSASLTNKVVAELMSGFPAAQIEKDFKTALASEGPGKVETVNKVGELLSQPGKNQKQKAEDLKRLNETVFKAFDELLKKNKVNARIQIHYGKMLNFIANSTSDSAEKGKLSAKAETVAREGIDLSPKRQQMYYILAEALFNQGRLEEAIEAIKYTVELEPSIPMSHANLATVYQSAGKFDLAVESMEKAVSLPDSTVQMRSQLILLYHVNGRLEDEARELEILKKIDSSAADKVKKTLESSK